MVSQWIYNKVDDKRVQLIYSQEGRYFYVVDVTNNDTLDIEIRYLQSAWDVICNAKLYITESRRVQLLHEVDLDSFISELVEILTKQTHLTYTTEFNYRKPDENGELKTHWKYITPIRDIYEAIQDLVVKY